jgi:hypothetical protein
MGASCVDNAALGPVDEPETVSPIARARPVDPAKELVIVDPSVIRDPLYTAFDAAYPSGAYPRGAWSFGRLVHNMLPAAERASSAAASAFVMRWLRTWETDQRPNPTVSAARARRAIRLLITEPWKTASGCADPASPETDDTCVLDMAKAPFVLAAIVNRPDLRIVTTDGTAIGGEGRFVFQVVGPTIALDAEGAQVIMDPTPKPQKFTVIFEYSLPVTTAADTLLWAKRWHHLGSQPFGADLNLALAKLTNGFAGPDTDPRRPNGNALNQIRTNEVALMGARFPTAGFAAAKQFWELREFRLSTQGLEPHTVNLEPSRDFDVARTGQVETEGTRTAELAEFLRTNNDAVIAGTYALPTGFSGNAALVGSAPYGAWGVPPGSTMHMFEGVTNAARNNFALSTCAGCHRHETDTRHFMHVTVVGAMEPSSKVDDRARIGVTASTPETATVLSNFLRDEIAPGGPRYEDFARVLVSLPGDLRTRPARRAH